MDDRNNLPRKQELKTATLANDDQINDDEECGETAPRDDTPYPDLSARGSHLQNELYQKDAGPSERHPAGIRECLEGCIARFTSKLFLAG